MVVFGEGDQVRVKAMPERGVRFMLMAGARDQRADRTLRAIRDEHGGGNPAGAGGPAQWDVREK